MMRPLTCAFFAGSLLLAPSFAEARQSIDLPYPVEQSWNAAIRLVRVDMGFTITERDRESGFLLFTYRDTTRSSPASIELIATDVGGVAGVRVVVQIAQMPSYMERHLLTRLDRKLHDDYGEPRRPPPREPDRDRSRDRERDRDRPREGEGQGQENQRPREGEGAPTNPDSRGQRREE
jgi:hypothetical protein